MKVLLSIKPEYAEKILAGEKLFEFRKAVFKNPEVKTVVIYATKPIGKVIGEFSIDGILSEKPSILWKLTSEFGGISKRFFDDYFQGREKAYAIKVGEAKRYDEPVLLQNLLCNSHPPQSFCYIS